MTEMFLAGITMDVLKSCPIIVLTDKDRVRALPIWVSPADAAALAIALEHEKQARPITHDLMQVVIETLGWHVKQVELNEMSESTLFATVKLVKVSADARNTVSEIGIDARPSDAIALAIRFQAPILVALEVLANASVSTDLNRDEHEAADFRHFVDNLKASDFNKLQKDR